MLDVLLKKIKSYIFIKYPPYEYEYIMNLDKKEYERYLRKYYEFNIGNKHLNLNHPKSLSEKVQWLKLYDSTHLKTQLTDKVLVRDWVKNKIGENYLKPVLWIGKSFDDIPFDSLPDNFIIQCNNGSKRYVVVKDKAKLLSNDYAEKYIKKIIDNWCSINYFPVSFEPQYKGYRTSNYY